MGACDVAGGTVARKGRARRFREARALKQGYDDGLFGDGDRTLADLEEDADERDEEPSWDPDEPTGSDWEDDEDDPLHDPRDEPRAG